MSLSKIKVELAPTHQPTGNRQRYISRPEELQRLLGFFVYEDYERWMLFIDGYHYEWADPSKIKSMEDLIYDVWSKIEFHHVWYHL